MGVIQEFKLKDYITLLGTFAGFFIMVLAIYWKAHLFGAFFIFIAVALDLLDGFIARKTKQINELGKQLDSLSDGIVFGVTPAILVFATFALPNTDSVLNRVGILPLPWWLMMITCFIFIAGAISRLAWFNISTNEGYSGLPTPLSASFIALTIAANVLAWELDYSPNWFNYFIQYAIPFILFFLAWLNVTDKVAYGKSIRKKSGKLKYFFLFILIVVIGTFILTFFNFPFREEVIFSGILLLWCVLIGFILLGFKNARMMKKDKNSHEIAKKE